jgi:phospholipid transport system substrate-binding protein
MQSIIRSCARLAGLALLTFSLLGAGMAGAADDPAVARIQTFYATLLEVMKHAKQLGISGRYEKLTPAVRETFDLPAMTRIAIGPPWTSLPPDQQTALVEAFSKMTFATYASRFDGYSGERFEVEPAPETRGKNRIVKTKLVESDGKSTVLNYLMHETPAGWKAIDVYLSGTVSELATRRSEFGGVLKSGGAPALVDNLRQRMEKLMKGE